MGIDINPFKSKLITINRTNKNIDYMTYGQWDEKIYSLKSLEFTHFLEVWIGSSNNKKFVMNQILKEINTIYGIVVRKRITPRILLMQLLYLKSNIEDIYQFSINMKLIRLLLNYND